MWNYYYLINNNHEKFIKIKQNTFINIISNDVYRYYWNKLSDNNINNLYDNINT